jgi:hypothetical protein
MAQSVWNTPSPALTNRTAPLQVKEPRRFNFDPRRLVAPPYCCPYPYPYCTLTHSLPPLLLPLPMSLLYTHSLPPFQVARAVELAETLAAHASFAAACAADAPALSPPLLARVSALLRRRALVLPRSPHSPLSCVHFRRVHLLRPRVPTRYRPIVPPPHALPPRVAPPH